MIPSIRAGVFHLTTRRTLVPAFNPFRDIVKRCIFRAVDEENKGNKDYAIERLRSRLQKPEEALSEISGDKTSPLHYLAGACPCSGVPLPVRKEPSLSFTKLLLSAYPSVKELNVAELTFFFNKYPGSILLSRNLDQLNVYGEAALHIAARVGYSDVVEQLLIRGASPNINPENGMIGTPLHAYIVSTVGFDPTFKIGNILIRYGADVNIRNANGDTPLFSLLPSFKNGKTLLRCSMNPLYNDVNRITKFHWSRFYEKSEWLLKQGARVVDGEKNLLAIYLKELDTSPNGNIDDSFLRPMVPLLAKNCSDVSLKDKRKWTLLHWAVYTNCEAAVDELHKKGLSEDECDIFGITPYKIALFYKNKVLMKTLKPKNDMEMELSKLEPGFFGEIANKLPYSRRGTTRLVTALSSDSTHEILRLEPLHIAMHSGNLKEVARIIKSGWNIYINKDLHVSHKKDNCSIILGFDKLFYSNDISNEFRHEVLKLLIDSKSSGITLSGELSYALSQLGWASEAGGEFAYDNYIISLFDRGLTPELFHKETGEDFKRTVYFYYRNSFDDERGYHEYPNHKGMCHIMEYAKKKSWIDSY